MNNVNKNTARKFINGHPVLANIIIILIVAALGILILYFSTAIFTKHGESDIVPGVEGTSYTQAIEKLHEAGFRTEIRDSLYKDDVKPGYVIEQFPKANSIVKPGRKIFLYINAVHPKEVIIDDDNSPREDALKGVSLRQGLARLEELGFKNVRIVRVLGDNDCIVKVMANGRTVKKTQRLPINTALTVEVYDGRLGELRDSLYNSEFGTPYLDYYNGDEGDVNESQSAEPAETAEPDNEEILSSAGSFD